MFELPEFENADKEALGKYSLTHRLIESRADNLALVRKVLKSTCRDVHAQLAFVWIGFVVLTLTTIYLVTLGAKRTNSVSPALEVVGEERTRADEVGMERDFEGL